MNTQPFSWEAYEKELQRNPDFKLFAKFSFDHLSQAEMDEISRRMLVFGKALRAEADALKAELKARKRSRITVIDGGNGGVAKIDPLPPGTPFRP